MTAVLKAGTSSRRATHTSAIPRGLRLTILLATAALVSLGTPMLAQTTRSVPRSAAAAALHEAVLTAQHGDPAKALALTLQLLAKSPAYGPAFKFKGALLEDAGQKTEAETAYEQALKLTPRDPELLFKVGVHTLLAKDYDRAIALLLQASKLSPRDSDTFFYLAQAYYLHGDPDSAIRAIGQSARFDPTNAPVLQKYGELLSSAGNNLEAVNWLRKAQKLDPTLPRISFDLGVASFRNQDLEAAADYTGKVVEAQPSDLSALELLAQIDVKLAHWQEAKDLFTRILDLQPNDVTASLELGHSELGLKQYQPAADTLERVLQQQPANVLAHFYLARAYTGLGRQADAAHQTELHNQLVALAASVVPQDEREIEKKTLVEARDLLTKGYEAEALKLFRARSKGPTATPGAPTMLVGVSYLYMGRQQDAQRCLNKAIEIEPSVHLARTYLGVLALRQQNFDEAERQFNLELKQDPNSQLAVAELGELRYRQGRWSEAAEQLSRSRSVDPRLLYLLSDSYFHLDQKKEATLTAELAAAYSRDDPAALQQLADLLNRNHEPELATRLLTK